MTHVTTRDQTQLYLKDWGNGRPVILIHGWPLSSDTWDDIALALAEAGLRAISYDRRGFGRSSQPWSGYDYDTLSDDLADVIAATDATDAVLVGFSMGGGEVARYMSRHGGKQVSQVAFIGSVVPSMLKTADNPDGIDAPTFEQLGTAMKEDRAKFFTAFFRDFYGEGLLNRPVSTEVLQWSHNLAMMAGLKGTLACAQAFAMTDFRADVATIRVPALIVHGSSDKTVPIDATARRLAKMLPQARLIEYDGGPHGLLASHKERIIADLLDFIVR